MPPTPVAQLRRSARPPKPVLKTVPRDRRPRPKKRNPPRPRAQPSDSAGPQEHIPSEGDDQNDYEVEHILDFRTHPNTKALQALCQWSRSWVDVDTLGNVQATLDILKIRNFKKIVSEQLGIAPEDVIFDNQGFIVPPQHMETYIRLFHHPRPPQPQQQPQPQQRQPRRKNVRSLAALQKRLREESNPQRREGLLRQIARVQQWSRIKIEDAPRSPSPTPSIQHSRSSSATPSVSDDPQYPRFFPHRPPMYIPH